MLIDKVDPQVLSLIVTTSPIKSNPDTFIIDTMLDSLTMQYTLKNVHIYIVCDGGKISGKNLQNKFKAGIVTELVFENYKIFKQRIKQKYGKHAQKYTIIEREQRYGFAQNIRYCMEEYAKTPLVMICQHDYIFQKQVNFHEIVQVMIKNRNQINYVTPMNKSYSNIPYKILFEKSNRKIKQHLIKQLYNEQLDKIPEIQQIIEDILGKNKTKFGVPLMPLYFWYDKTHIASRQYYLKVVFQEDGYYDSILNKYLKTVNFVEDTFGHYMKRKIENNPESIHQMGAYVLWGDDPVFYHQGGRTFMTNEQKIQYQNMAPKNKPYKKEPQTYLNDLLQDQ